MKSSLAIQFEHSVGRAPWLCPGRKVFVACSGGPDSTALFYLLRSLAETRRFKLGLLHFNHRLRGRESDRDERFVKRLAKKFGVPYCGGRGDVRKFRKQHHFSPEEAARQLRYDFFTKAVRRHRCAVVVLAHTQDDQAETVLMRILQGTGLQGLAGIRPVLKIGGLTLIRPLLPFPKKDILAWLKENRIPFCRDRSNDSEQFVRNKIRRRLIPWIAREINPRVVPALARIPSIVEDENRAVRDLEKDAWKKVFTGFRKPRLSMDREAFIQLAPPIQFRVLNRALKKIDPQSGLSFDAWKILRKGLSGGRYRRSLPRDIDFVLTSSEAFLCKK